MNGLAGSGGSGLLGAGGGSREELRVVGGVGSAREGQVVRIFFITTGNLDWVNKGWVGQFFLNQIVFLDWGTRVRSGSSFFFWIFS